LTTAQGKLSAVNFLMPHVQRIANPLLRSEWATRISQQLRVEEPVLREALRKAAAERRGEVKTKPELIARSARPAERRLVQMLIEADDFRQRLAQEITKENLHAGLETERVFAALLPICAEGGRPDAATLATTLDEQDRRLLFDIAFEPSAPPDWDEAESCLGVQRRKRAEVELMAVQKEIEVHSARSSAQAAAAGAPNRLNELLARKQELRKRLGDA
jgi:DNA primase